MPSSSLFTVFIPAFHHPEFLRQSIQSVLSQTHRNIELILIDNGALPDVKKCLSEAKESDARINIISFAENQFSFDDPHLMIHVCWNAALQAAAGEYIIHLSYDDMFSPDYLEKMIALFDENPACTSAAGLPVGINIDGSRHDSSFMGGNSRPRYVEGYILALDRLRGGKMFQAPGDIFTFRRETLIAAGGYHRSLEDSQLFGIVPFGVSGFDSSAYKLWRYHDGQLNKELANAGIFTTASAESLIRDWQLEGRWQVFGEDVAREVISVFRQKEAKAASAIFVRNLSAFRFGACLKTFSLAWRFSGFWASFHWRSLPKLLWRYRRHFASNALKFMGMQEHVRRLTGGPRAAKR